MDNLNELVKEYVTAINTLDEMRKELKEQGERLEAQLRVARGTQDVTAAAERTRRARVTDLSATPLYKKVLGLIAEEPRRYHRLLELTGATQNALTATLARMQREGVAVNLGNRQKAIWVRCTDDLRRAMERVVK